jgi:voltage-gated potassium channel
MSRKRIYEIIEKSDGKDTLSTFYDIAMIVVIALSLIPLAFKEDNSFFRITDKVTVGIFIADYILRWLTADYKYEKHTFSSFARYPLSIMAIIDLISILPSLTVVNSGFKVLRILRMLRAMRVFRVFKAVRYSKSFEIIGNVLRTSKNSLIAVCVLAGGYILVSALIIFNVEPESFGNFFDAVYWATVSLTTVGYGDIYPVSTMGRIITMLSSVFGIAIVALPAGIITAGYMTELERRSSHDEDKEQQP